MPDEGAARPLPAPAGDWPETLHPVLRRVYAARGVRGGRELDQRLAELLPPHALDGLPRACALLREAIRRQARIVVVGEYDADGATGTAVAVRGLRALGAREVEYAVPNRFRHGYGLSAALVEELRPRDPHLLLTVDNGIAAHAGVAAAKAHGIDVIVTDHHLPGETPPPADAIVHWWPMRESFVQGSGSAALNNLAGVGVMFYLLLALRAELRAHGSFAAGAEPDLAALLDLVALGTVADLVPLDRNNRILVAAGLKRIQSGRACAGVAALFAEAGRDPTRAVASDLAFAIAPRINAAGRLEDMRLGIECLLADDPRRARELAATLSAINAERRELQATMVEQAEAALRRCVTSRDGDELPHGLVLFDPDWHQGVIGLVASRLKESLGRPVIAFAPANATDGAGMEPSAAADGADLRGSGRSIHGFHLRDALAEIDAREPGLLRRFGGHAMAAGMSLERTALARFAAAFDALARERIAPEAFESVLLSDGELDPSDFSLELAEQLRAGGPWGQAFPEPLFDGEFALVDWRVVGERHLRLSLRHPGGGTPLPAMLFHGATSTPPPARLRAAFALDVNDWNGTRTLRLLLRHIEPV